MASLITRAGRLDLCTAASAWLTGTHKVALLGPTYTPAVTDTASVIATYELSGTGYTAGYGGSGRKTLASKTLATSSAGRTVFDAADLTWTAINAGTAGWLAVVRETGGSDATSVLVAVLAYPVTLTDGSDLVVTWPTTGLFYLAD